MAFETAGETPLIPVGEHVLTLASIERKRVKSQYATAEDGMVEKILWLFRSNQTTDGGEAFEYAHWSGLVYGSGKATLTAFLDQIVPGMNRDMARTMDENTLIGKKFKALLRHKRSDDGEKRYAELVFIEPYQPSRKRAVAEDDED